MSLARARSRLPARRSRHSKAVNTRRYSGLLRRMLLWLLWGRGARMHRRTRRLRRRTCAGPYGLWSRKGSSNRSRSSNSRTGRRVILDDDTIVFLARGGQGQRRGRCCSASGSANEGSSSRSRRHLRKWDSSISDWSNRCRRRTARQRRRGGGRRAASRGRNGSGQNRRCHRHCCCDWGWNRRGSRHRRCNRSRRRRRCFRTRKHHHLLFLLRGQQGADGARVDGGRGDRRRRRSRLCANGSSSDVRCRCSGRRMRLAVLCSRRCGRGRSRGGSTWLLRL